MKVIGLNGSANTNGNTKKILYNILKHLETMGVSTEIIDIHPIVSDLRSPFCTVCSSPCNGKCYQGTLLEEAFQKLQRADGILMGSPSYYGTLSGQIKCFFDKSRKMRTNKGLYNKIAAGVTVGASKYGGQETTMKALHDIMLVHGMIIIGDGFWEEDCGHHGVCVHSPFESDEIAFKRCEILAKRMYEVCLNTMNLRINKF